MIIKGQCLQVEMDTAPAADTPSKQVTVVGDVHQAARDDGDTENTIISYLATAKTCAQVETETAPSAATQSKPVTVVGDAHPAVDDDVITVLGDDTENVVVSDLSTVMTSVQAEEDTAPAAATSSKQVTVVGGAHSVARARSRTMSLERAPRGLRPSTPAMRTTDGVFICTAANRDEWKIVPAEHTKVVVVGDSNLRRFSSIPKGWEVHCLPGAKLQHVNSAVEDLLLRCPDNLSVVYVQAVINHRDERPEQYKRDVEWLMRLNSQTPIHIAFAAVPKPPSLTAAQRQNIDALNTMIAEALVDQYVQPIAEDHFEILQKDTYKIHHTGYTCTNQSVNFLSGLSSDATARTTMGVTVKKCHIIITQR